MHDGYCTLKRRRRAGGGKNRDSSGGRRGGGKKKTRPSKKGKFKGEVTRAGEGGNALF